MQAGVPGKKKSRNADPGVRVQVHLLDTLNSISLVAVLTPCEIAGRKDLLQQDRHNMSPGQSCFESATAPFVTKPLNMLLSVAVPSKNS